ncbi:MAG: GGDEF domain-containing protein [Planctomycetes bacterium]|nr:GGDEF domain-containing protein [Planctomycetota bacterium]
MTGPPASSPNDGPAAPRRRRQRLLIVGADPLAPRAEGRLVTAPARATNLFEAIGAISAVGAAEPIGAVLVPSDLIPSAESDVAAAIRRLDPSLVLIRVVDAGGPDPQPSARGFDHVARAPIDAETLAELLGREWLTAAVAGTETVADAVADTDTVPASVAPVDAMGDTDLLHAVMHDPDGVERAAVALARQQTGWNDLAVRDEANAEDTHAEISDGERRFGVLSSRVASAGELAPWAQWLARWMTLDAAYREYRLLAYRDELTGAWNRRYMKRFLSEVIDEARSRRRPITVMVFDIDDFKRYNDAFGHDAGDVILCETVSLLNSVIRESDRVCRIGGDEFAVVFADLEPRASGSTHPASVELLARRFQAQVSAMRFPKLGLEAPGTLSISGGLATFPWDGDDPGTLLRLADHRALESKRRGKNHLTFGPGATDV